MSERITWTESRFGGYDGRAGGLLLFGVHFGVKRQANMWSLSTTLPIKAPTLGQEHPTATHAKIAAEQLLEAFIARLTTQPADLRAGANEGEGA